MKIDSAIDKNITRKWTKREINKKKTLIYIFSGLIFAVWLFGNMRRMQQCNE